jgi:hypothetical protein
VVALSQIAKLAIIQGRARVGQALRIRMSSPPFLNTAFPVPL